MKTKLSEFIFADMVVRYEKDEEGIASLLLLPAGRRETTEKTECASENLVQVKYTGDTYNETYAQGLSLRNGESTRRMKYEAQTVEETGDATSVVTTLRDDRGYRIEHVLTHLAGAPYVTIRNTFFNEGKAPVTLELFESFSLGGLTPYLPEDASLAMDIYRFRTAWSAEGRLVVDSVEELGLERSWALHSVRSERYGQVGSMPVNHFHPFGAVHDKKTGVFWGAMLAHNASWQMEFYRKDNGLSFGGGLADREFGHWMKEVLPGECFTAPTAILTVAEGKEGADFDLFCQRLTEAALPYWEGQPESERELPILFNEYCTTWGNPSHENIAEILSAIRGKGISYFVIDCGWYKQPGIPWDRGMGDYLVSKELFPEGLKKTVEMIRAEGYRPGIWFEIENVAPAAEAYQETDHLLKRDGKPLTTYARRFWDMSDPWVEQHLAERVIGTLKTYDFGYMKIDYNETIGIGCDGAESPGEGLRRNLAATESFIRRVRAEVPGIVLENCSSGGHRLEPLMMSLCAMASFSDAHEVAEIPVIAATLHRLIHPAQSQIWAVIRESDTMERIVYSLAATMLGRMCLSGDVTQLSGEQWDAIDRGIAFYKKAAHLIRDGKSILTREGSASMRHPDGWQAVDRFAGKEHLVVLHAFAGEGPREIRLPIYGGGSYRITDTYAAGEHAIAAAEDRLVVTLSPFTAAAVLLEAVQ